MTCRADFQCILKPNSQDNDKKIWKIEKVLQLVGELKEKKAVVSFDFWALFQSISVKETIGLIEDCLHKQ